MVIILCGSYQSLNVETGDRMCNIGRIRQIIANEAKPTTAAEVMITSIPIKLKELVYARRIQRVESKEHKW